MIVQSTNQLIKRRKPIRLKEYDYSLDGSYFVTICTKDREELFGQIIDGTMQMKRYGEIVQSCWMNL